MATITIYRTILDGNLGEGWNCQESAAKAFAAALKSQWEKDLSGLAAEEHEVEVSVKVASNTSGDSGITSINVEGCDYDTAFEIHQRVKYELSDENRVWERFCNSPEAEALAA